MGLLREIPTSLLRTSYVGRFSWSRRGSPDLHLRELVGVWDGRTRGTPFEGVRLCPPDSGTLRRPRFPRYLEVDHGVPVKVG